MGRFAKGPSDTGGFKYPRRRVTSTDPKPILTKTEALSPAPVPSPAVEPSIPEVVQTEEVALEQPSPAMPTEETMPAPVVEPVETSEQEETEQPTLVVAKPEQAAAEEDTLTILLPEPHAEAVDDTVGPGESHMSESDVQEDDEEEESEEEEAVKPTPASPIPTAPIPPTIPKIVKQNPKPTPKPSSPVLKKVTLAPMINPSPAAPPQQGLLAKIKTSFPYSTHLLALLLVCVTCVLLRMLYQFGADLASGLDLPTQLIRFAKLATLFGVVAVCVNFVEDNKELPEIPSAPSLEAHYPRLRPSKLSKNKRKMMMMGSPKEE